MKVQAKAKYIRISPYKLRLLVDVVRGNTVGEALSWLRTVSMKRGIPVFKVIASAFANAKNNTKKQNFSEYDFIIKDIRVDAGPTIRYYKPGAMGRSNIQRKKMSHICVVIEKKNTISTGV